MQSHPRGPSRAGARRASPGRRSAGVVAASLLFAASPLFASATWAQEPSAREPSAQEPQSGSYRLQQQTVNAGGETATSASFRVDGSLAQPATVGETASPSFLVQSGFWTGLSTRRLLRVEGAGSGDGIVEGPGIACSISAGIASGDCAESFLDGELVELVATPAASNQFDGWSQCDSASATLTGGTCEVMIADGRSVLATFTLQGALGDRVWRDVDGDGQQDPSEPGLGGVTVRLRDEEGYSASTVTAGDGSYSFVDVPPNTYTVSIDTSTLPAGVVATHDADGAATPHQATVTVGSGDSLTNVDFGYQPLVNLAITKEDDVDPLPGGQTLTYTLTVQNLGPGIATNVRVTDNLPAGTRLVKTVGCAEDPSGAPTCSLGTLGIGATASFTLEVSIDPGPPASITNTATVTATEVDIDPADNSASESTELDSTPPRIEMVGVDPATADGELEPCETVHGQEIERLLVAFDEPMFDPMGDELAHDVTNPASWSLIAAGPDLELATTSCGPAAGDDIALPLVAITYSDATRVAELDPGRALAPGLYRLFGCGDGPNELRDRGGTSLDGDADGDAGGDFVQSFRADPENLLANGHFDCNLEGFGLQRERVEEIEFSAVDVDGSGDSGSARLEELSGERLLALSQCAAIDAASAELELEMSVGARLVEPASLPGVSLTLRCQFYDRLGCGGAALSTPVSASDLLLAADVGAWIDYTLDLTAPAGARSAACEVELRGLGFTADLDQVRLVEWLGGDPLFEDGFESGSTSQWSGTP